jgi:RNA polymerase sigma factor (sigma-70 family)
MTMHGATLSRVIQTATDRGRETVTDRDLLLRFANDADQEAFEALVRRHTGLVLSVCRRALSNTQDAEDACQATFLILARKARSGRWQASIANWLFATARRVARDVRRAAGRRAKREGRAAVPESVVPVDRMTGRELLDAIDEELDRLPPIYREPLLLYYQAELARDEIAARLGIPPGTVKIRLERGRKRLSDALTKRGVTIGAGLLTLMATSPAGASLPRFVESIVAAVTGSPPPAVAALAEDAAMSGLVKKVLVILAAAGLVGFGLAAVPTPGGQPKDPPPAVKPEPADTTAAGEKTFGGQVVGPDGKPVAGAKLYTLYYTPKILPIPARGTSDADGKFRFAVEKKSFDSSLSQRPWDETIVVAAADGYGLGAPKFEPGRMPGESGWSIRLAKDDVPITGRILDLQGRPVAGATVSVHNLYWPTKGDDLTAWVTQLKTTKEAFPAIRAHLIGLDGLYMGRDVGRVIQPAVTNAEGRFTLKGVGRERVVTLRVDGPTIVSTEFWAMTRPGDKIVASLFGRGQGEVTFVGADSEHIVPPCQPIEGVVRDKDTGKPLPGAVVQAYAIGNRQVEPGTSLRAETDADGKYKLLGLPKGRNQIRAVSPDGQPYLSMAATVPDGPGLEPVAVDFKLKRGVWISGKVTDKVTGRPVMTTIQYVVFADNPNRAEAPGLTMESNLWTRGDGTFRFAGLPGRGVVAATAPGGGYLSGVGADRIKDFERLFLNPMVHTVAEVNPEKGAEAVTCELVLDPGGTLKGTVVGPDGKPLAGTLASGLKGGHDAWDERPAPTAEFTVPAVTAAEPRLLQFTHPGKKLAGSLVVKGTEKGPLTVKLEAAGVLTGRFVTTNGKPLAEVEVLALTSGPVASPLDKPKADVTAGTFPPGQRTDKDGKFRIEGLPAGLTYNLAVRRGMYVLVPAGDTGKVTVKAGETKDLGDLKVKLLDE